MQIAYQRSNDASKMYFDSSKHYIPSRECKWAMFIFSFHFVALDPSSQRVIALSCWVTLMVEWILFFWKLGPSRWTLFSDCCGSFQPRKAIFSCFPSCLMHLYVCVCKILMSGSLWCVSIPIICVAMWDYEVISNALITCTCDYRWKIAFWLILAFLTMFVHAFCEIALSPFK